ncbi:small kinetochore-associated protein isoform X2 [Austrofundulus limnaeus]|uniref:Small kinetochore-associated protein isoform X2 n=1 Tax=Austrofundulus limnaeus TaxID=52670 RepID=A0A2I4BT22_AUSLI|nr:PREDICTED: uncharacterized protein LOC106522411 isoform X2 [Austrofundulus limnaeus]
MSSKIPKEAKKQVTKQEAKDTAAANTVHRPDGNIKALKENHPRKNVAPKIQKGISTRHGQQAELKEQNEELQKNLLETQQRVAELKLQINELQNKNVEMKKNLHDCHVLLVSAKVDPVSGKASGDAARDREEERKEVMGVSTELLRELKAFGDAAAQQCSSLKEIQTNIEDMSKAREVMKQERQNFSQQAAEMEEALKEAERLLM